MNDNGTKIVYRMKKGKPVSIRRPFARKPKWEQLKYTESTDSVFACLRCGEISHFTNSFCDFCGGQGEWHPIWIAILNGACWHFKGLYQKQTLPSWPPYRWLKMGE